MPTKNWVPRANGEGGIGTEALKWGSVHAVSGNIDNYDSAIDTLQTKVTTLEHAYAGAKAAATVADMTDHNQIYVYVGSETGYTNGNWYYWNGTAWTSGGVYNATALETDKTLTVSGAAADAKKVGNLVNLSYIQPVYAGAAKNFIKKIIKNERASCTIAFTGNIQAVIRNANGCAQYLTIQTGTDDYVISNTSGLLFDVETGEVESFNGYWTDVTTSTALPHNKYPLVICIFGQLFSELPFLQDEIVNGEKVFAVTSTNPAHLIKSIVKDGASLTVEINGNSHIFCKNETGKFLHQNKLSNDQSFTLNNLDCILYNTYTEELSLFHDTNFGEESSVMSQSDEILLINVYGCLYSPIPSVQCELNFVPSNILAIGAGGNPIINTINENSLIVNVTFNSHFYLLFKNELGNLRYLDITSSDSSYTLNNVYGMFVNTDTGELTIETGFWVDDDSFWKISSNKLLLFANLWGRLVSPISNLNEELQIKQNTPLRNEINAMIEGVVGDGANYQKVINITPNNSFCQIRTAINAITDASSTNRYKLFIANGTYEEIDIVTKDYVDLIGESIDGVVLNCNGLSTKISPSNYSNNTYSSIPVNTIPKAWRHLMYHMSNSTISNMTLKANNTKYIIHQDNFSQKYTATVKNCRLIREDVWDGNETDYDQGLQNLVGVGAAGGQNQVYNHCTFIKKLKNYPATTQNNAQDMCALFWHNWNNQSEKCSLTVEDCNIFGCHIAVLSELGSDNQDTVNIINTKADSDRFGIFYTLTPGFYKVNGVVVTDPDLIPYNIKLNISGSNPGFVVPRTNRMGALDNIINSYTNKLVPISATVKIGQPVSYDNLFGEAETISNSAPFGVAMEAGMSGDIITLNTGKVAYCLFASGTYTYGTPVYLNGGYFTTSANGNVVGYIRKSVTLSSEGLVEVIFK